MYSSVRDRHTHTSHKAVSVNCAIKALKGIVDEITLMWKSMTDAVHDMQASETPPTLIFLSHQPSTLSRALPLTRIDFQSEKKKKNALLELPSFLLMHIQTPHTNTLS